MKCKKRRQRPLLVDPKEHTLSIINNLNPADAEQIAKIVCQDYLADLWDQQCDMEDDEPDEDEEPWHVTYEWERDTPEPGEPIMDPRELMSDPETLRKIYRAIVRGELSNEHVLIR
jgi:hypothetical protein